jgi:hypothetical protein
MDQAWAGGEIRLERFPVEQRFMDGVFYDTAAIGWIARCSTEHVRRACRNGTLGAAQDRERGHWLASGEECRSWVNRGRPSGQ